MNLFHYGAVIPWKADGDFKFTSVTDFGQSDAFFHPTEGNAPYTSTSVVLGGEDNKWQMKESECGKAYKVLFLTAKGKEKMLIYRLRRTVSGRRCHSERMEHRQRHPDG